MKSEGGVGSPSRMGAESITLPWHWCGFRCVPKLGWDASVKLNEARHGGGWIFVMLFSFPSFIHFFKGGGLLDSLLLFSESDFKWNFPAEDTSHFGRPKVCERSV